MALVATSHNGQGRAGDVLPRWSAPLLDGHAEQADAGGLARHALLHRLHLRQGAPAIMGVYDAACFQGVLELSLTLARPCNAHAVLTGAWDLLQRTRATDAHAALPRPPAPNWGD